ncbi:DEAD/DEAH box helicase [Alicyclobacillus pomorum]|uniref:DEAD/DEAH box helicase n=1 Tax=Alicyclobacillus pomorum TaxID=204470 RepID=UPI000424C5E6|nr:DEAD/DEAH box helicase [Alicyclobacillus pomorum]
MAKTSRKLPTTEQPTVQLCGQYLPGKTFAEPGTGVFWSTESDLTEKEVEHHLRSILGDAADVRFSAVGVQRVDAKNAVSVDEATFFAVVCKLASSVRPSSNALEPFGQQVSSELAFYAHLLRLAAALVDSGEVLAFAAPQTSAWPDVYDICFELAASGEDALGAWGSAVGNYSAVWAPAWSNPKHRALRSMWMSVAEELWAKPTPSGLRDLRVPHSPSLLAELWIWRCVDILMRKFGKPKLALRHDLGSSYRVMYRGEEELFDRWVAALEGPDNAFFADGWLIWRTLRHVLAPSGWQREWLTDKSGKTNYHLEVELVPPPMDGALADWKLVLYVAHNEWNARAPLADWWLQSGRRWQIGQEILEAPDTWILPKLLEVADIVPALKHALGQPAVSECSLSPEEVFTFLTEQLLQLEDISVPVRYPDVSTQSLADVRIKMQVRRTRPKATSSRKGMPAERWFSADQLVDFDWTVVLGDVELSQQEFEQMVERRTPFVQVGGSWRLVPIQAVLEQIEQLRAGRGSENLGAVQFLRAVLMAQSEGEDSVQVDVEFDEGATDARRILKALLDARTPTLQPTPDGFQGTLRDYQRFGYSWLWHLRSAGCGAVLADDMGLGKTIQVLAYLLRLKETGCARGVHLLVCPTSLVQNWRSEMAKFAPSLKVYVHHGADRNVSVESGRSPLEVALEECDVVMTTYATVVRDLELLQPLAWDVVIADEAQNIKNQDTKQAQAICSLMGYHRVALTGTPMENRLEELWSILQFVNPGYLGSAAWFRKTFAQPIAQGREGEAAARRLHRLLQPVLLRRSKTDPAIQMELPEKWEYTQYAGLTTEQAALYQAIVNQLFVELPSEGMSRRGQILASLVRLKQVCDHPCLIQGGRTGPDRSGKLKLLLDLLEPVVSEGEAALVFTQFREMGSILCSALEERFGWRPRFLHGGLSASERGELVERFQSGQDPSPVLVLSLKAGGVGLNLTRANHVFHYDRWWNPAVEDQATDRAFRIGQVRDVQVHKLVCPGTLEERIDALIQSKRSLSSAVVGRSESWITELDNDALQSLFALDLQAALEDDEWRSEK